MDVPRRTILAALSADAECVGRIWRLYGAHDTLALVLASDPDELIRVVVPLTRVQKRTESHLAGVLIDLTTPLSMLAWAERPAAEHTANLALAAKGAIEVIDPLTEVGIGSVVPLIVVSADDTLRARLDVLGMDSVQ